MKNRILIMCLLLCGTAMAQKNDSTTQRLNTIKLDLTSHFLYRNALILAYERVTRPNQSFVILGGYQEFPKVTSLGSNIGVKNDKKVNGLKIGADYRFYLRKENKFRAPHGVYIGPYTTFHVYNNSRVIEVDNNGTPEEAILDSRFSIFNLGFQVGYQFVIHNRWTIDLAFVGPSLSNYRYNIELGGTYNFDKEDIQNEILLELIDRFPFLDEVISDKEASRSGRLNSWSYGYRYQLTVGYHFGRKK